LSPCKADTGTDHKLLCRPNIVKPRREIIADTIEHFISHVGGEEVDPLIACHVFVHEFGK
jgi:hypothetical protein